MIDRITLGFFFIQHLLMTYNNGVCIFEKTVEKILSQIMNRPIDLPFHMIPKPIFFIIGILLLFHGLYNTKHLPRYYGLIIALFFFIYSLFINHFYNEELYEGFYLHQYFDIIQNTYKVILIIGALLFLEVLLW